VENWDDWNTVAPGLRSSNIRASFNYERWKQVLAKIVSSNYLPNEPNHSIYVLFMDSHTNFDPWVKDGQDEATCAFHSYVNGLSGTGINAADTYFFAVLGYADSTSVCYQIADRAMKFTTNNPSRDNSNYVKAVSYLNTLTHELMEIMTDPLLGSGKDANGNIVNMGWYAAKDADSISENADFCVMQFSGTPTTKYTVDDQSNSCTIQSNFKFTATVGTRTKTHYIALQDVLHPVSKACVRAP
jgi:hypothetical protein